jgi:hypothetical protein
MISTVFTPPLSLTSLHVTQMQLSKETAENLFSPAMSTICMRQHCTMYLQVTWEMSVESRGRLSWKQIADPST